MTALTEHTLILTHRQLNKHPTVKSFDKIRNEFVN